MTFPWRDVQWLFAMTFTGIWCVGPMGMTKRAASWQNQQNDCAPSDDSDEPSLIRVFAVRMKKAWDLSYPFSAQWRLWSDWAHSHFVGFVTRRLKQTWMWFGDSRRQGKVYWYCCNAICGVPMRGWDLGKRQSHTVYWRWMVFNIGWVHWYWHHWGGPQSISKLFRGLTPAGPPLLRLWSIFSSWRLVKL